MLLLLLACEEPAPPAEVQPRGELPDYAAPAPTLRRLTQEQYRNALTDLFGSELILPSSLEPDVESEGLQSVGAGISSISAWGVEHYEEAAFDVAEQVAPGLATCTPVDVVDAECAGQTLRPVARRAWRRAPTEEELARLVAVSGQASTVLGDFDAGLVYGLAAVLQSPFFLYRQELGADGRLTDLELASKLSFFLWNTIPDEELLAAAEAGELSTEEGYAAQVDRLLADARAKQGARAFFTDMLDLDQLDALSKDTTVFTHMSEEVGPAAREETLLGLEHIVFAEDGDLLDIYTTRRTFVNRKLAAIYNIPAPSMDGFAETSFPADSGRRGLLGQVSTLALHAHPVSTSVTRRGLFVREVLLCQDIPPPPAGVDTSIPEASGEAPTMRDRVARHLEDPTCASCHQITDPIGLGLENFDGLGSWRDSENGHPIDASGELEGASFSGPASLATVLRESEDAAPCFAETLYRYANGRAVGEEEEDLVEWHAEGFMLAGDRMLWLMRDISLSPGFREVSP